jgi:hypothetical protein
MKNLILMGIAIAAFNCFATAQSAEADFRGFKWGSSFANVQSGEQAKFVSKEYDDLLLYHDLLAGSDCDVIYQFNDNNKLIGGTYAFTKKYSNPQFYVQDYNKFKQLLTTKYGTPSSEREDLSPNTTTEEKENYGQAVRDGKLVLNSVWSTNRSIIKIILETQDKQPALLIYYKAKSLDEFENNAALKSALPKL